MAYPTTGDLVGASSDAALTSLDAPQQDELRDSAIHAIEQHCHQSFTQQGTVSSPVTRVLDSPGGEVVWLSKRLATLTGFSAIGSSLDLTEVAVGEDHDRLVVVPVDVEGSTWLLRAQAELSGHERRAFPEGLNRLYVTGVWGWLDSDWTDALVSVARALRFDMEDRANLGGGDLPETARLARSAGVRSISQGGVALSLDVGEPLLSPRVRRELSGFVWQGRIAAVV